MQSDFTLTIEREFDAPPARVFDAWVDPKSPVGWWGPKGFSEVFNESDPRPNGRYRLGMRAPDGSVHVNGGVYLEIVRPERLVMTHGWENAAGEFGHETVVTVTFSETAAGKTHMRFHQTGFTSTASRDGHEGGWSEAFDDLAAALARHAAAAA